MQWLTIFGVDTFCDLLQNFFFAAGVEGRQPCQKHVQNDSYAPDIALFIVCPFLKNHLWRDVVNSAYEASDVFLHRGSCPEVNNFDSVVRIEEHVLGLQISVADFLRMAVVDCQQDLLNDVSSTRLAEHLLGLRLSVNGVVEIASCAEFSHQVELSLVLKDLEDGDDVLMRELSKDGCLVQKIIAQLVIAILLRYQLDSPLLA